MIFEACSFWLVLYIMLPLTDRQKRQRKNLKTFLLNGFINIEHLESALLERNPSMNEDQKEKI